MKLILGHNQFLGISHTSESSASEKDRLFSDPANILQVVKIANENGFDTMVIEAHPRMRAFMDLYEKDGTFDMKFLLQVPYVSGYVRRMAESGIKGIVKEIITDAPVTSLVATPFQLLPKLIRSDYMGMGVKALDLETSKYSQYDISGVLMHNVVSDLLLSFDGESAFGDYFDSVRRRFGVNAGLITLNLEMMVGQLKEWGLRPGTVITPINPYGFDMNPSKESVEKVVNTSDLDIYAMNIMGGGSIPLAVSSEYLRGLQGLSGVIVGASSRKHIEELSRTFK